MSEYFRYFFISERIGAVKPDKPFYDACMRKLEGIRPDQVMVIGDSLSSYISGGIAYGLHTCWYNPTGRSSAIQPDYVVSRLDEIRGIL